MVSFSSDDFPKYWTYAVGRDFTSTATGEPVTWAPGHPNTLDGGSQVCEFDVPESVHCAAISKDERFLAFGAGSDIQIYSIDVTDIARPVVEEFQTLKGHLGSVYAVAFSPKDSNILVSCVGHSRYLEDVPQQVIVWDLSAQRRRPHLEESVLRGLGERAVVAVEEGISTARAQNQSPAQEASEWQLTADEREGLLETIRTSLSRSNARFRTADLPKLHGRIIQLGSSYDAASPISPDGRTLLFLPGDEPRYNDDVPWNFCAFDIASATIVQTFVGHRDCIMWVGYSPDGGLVGSTAWDGTSRIWDADTGAVRHVLRFWSESDPGPDTGIETFNPGQNWTAAFSPDGVLFAATSGKGWIKVWDVRSGAEVSRFEFGKPSGWCRTLNWNPDGATLAIGGESLGKIMIVDVRDGGRVLHERLLSTEKAAVDEPVIRSMMARHLEVRKVQWFDRGRKLAYFTGGDCSLEVVDSEAGRKWRFAPPEEEYKREGRDRDFFGGIFVVFKRAALLLGISGKKGRVWNLEL